MSRAPGPSGAPGGAALPVERHPGGTGRPLAPRTTLFGRSAEQAQVGELLAGGRRLVTLTGPGGIGKTRVAQAVADAAHAAGRFDEVHLVPLADVEPGGVLAAVGSAIGAGEGSGGRPVGFEGLSRVLDRGRRLLVLDTFEHLMDEVGVVGELLSGTERLVALVTSRRTLRLDAGAAVEAVVEIGPLACEPGGPATELFRDRSEPALARRGGAALDAVTAAAVCDALGGSPLAIELAAARTATLPPSTVVAWCGRGAPDRRLLDLLAHGGPNRPVRHRSVAATAAWSDELLTPPARRLLRRLGSFAGPFRLRDVEGVHASDPGAAGSTLDALTDLVELHLVEPAAGPGTDAWFRLLDPLREFARERGEAEGTAVEDGQAHLDHFGALAARAAVAVEGPDEAAWRELVEAERPNLLAALRFAERTGQSGRAGALALDLGPYWLHAGPMREGRAVFDRLGTEVGGSLSAAIRCWSARLAVEDGDVERVAELDAAWMVLPPDLDGRRRRWCDEHVAQALLAVGDHRRAASVVASLEAGTADDPYGRVVALLLRSRLAHHDGERDAATEFARQALVAADRMGHLRLGARAAQALGELATGGTDDLVRALDRYESVGDRRGVVLTSANLGSVAIEAGDRHAAAAWLRRTLDEARSIHYRTGEAFAVMGVVVLAVDDRRWRDGLGLHASLERMAPTAIQLVPPEAAEGYRDQVARARRELGEAASEAALAAAPHRWADALDRADELIRSFAEAEASRGRRPGRAAGGGSLTEREVEVLVLLASGATNPQIAASLYLSPKTVMHHTSSIFRKLGVRGRAEAVDVGHRTGLLAD